MLTRAVERHARIRCDGAQVLQDLSAHRQLVLRRRVQRVDDDGGDVARRAVRILRAVGEHPFREGRRGRPCVLAAFETEERHIPLPGAFHNRDLVLLQIRHRIAIAVLDHDRELNKGGRSAERRLSRRLGPCKLVNSSRTKRQHCSDPCEGAAET